MIHSVTPTNPQTVAVVNCFQFINFIDDSQYTNKVGDIVTSCELLSVH